MDLNTVEDPELRQWAKTHFRQVQLRDPYGVLSARWGRPPEQHGHIGTVLAVAAGTAVVVGAVWWWKKRKGSEAPARVSMGGLDALMAA